MFFIVSHSVLTKKKMISTWTKLTSSFGFNNVDVSFAVIYTVSTVGLIFLVTQVTIYRFWSRQGVKGPRPWPLIGNSIDTIFGQPLLERMTHFWNKYGPVHGIYRGIVPHLIIGDPDMLKDVLVRDWHVFADRRGGCVDGNSITDNFLVSLSGN